MSQDNTQSTGAIWGWPIVFGVLTTVGLVGALFSDGGAGDLLAGACLWAPALACLWWGWLRHPIAHWRQRQGSAKRP